jgi:hypothetical protein
VQGTELGKDLLGPRHRFKPIWKRIQMSWAPRAWSGKGKGCEFQAFMSPWAYDSLSWIWDANGSKSHITITRANIRYSGIRILRYASLTVLRY